MADKERKSVWSFDDLPDQGGGAAFKTLLKYLEPLRKDGGKVLKVLAVLLLLFGASRVFFQLEPEEEAVVLRLGKPLPETVGAGLHTRIPFVDQVYRAPVHRQQRMEFGYRSAGSAGVTKAKEEEESLMLTGDLMLVHVRWSLVYKIENIHAWLFEIKDRDQTIRDISMGVMRQIVGDYSLEEVLTSRQLEVATFAQETTQAALREKVPTGVVITEVAIKSADVPEAARKAFDDLTRTLAKVQGELAESKAEQDNAIGRARRQKNEAIGKAENQRAQVIENALGEALAFLAKSTEYERAPEITRQWMYLKTMTQVLVGLDEKLVIEDGGGSSVAKHLPLKDFFPPTPMASKAGGAK